MLLAFALPASAGLLLNEVLYSPSSTDTGNEWVELCNPDSGTVSLAGYTIESGGATWELSYALTGGSIEGGGYALVGLGSADNPGRFDPDLQNGGDESDGVRLLDPDGDVVDVVLYDSPDSNNLGDEGGTATAFAPDVGDDESIGRGVDCVDTVGAEGWVEFESPTPGAENEAGGTDDTGTTTGDADCSGTVTINEFSANTDMEYVELHVEGSADLSGWVVEFGTSSYNKDVTIPAGTEVSDGLFVIGSAGAAYKDLEADMDFGNATENADALRITCNGTPIDTVVYAKDGNANTDSWADDSGEIAESLAPMSTATQSPSRGPDGHDTNDCGDDFALNEPTPGEPNPSPPECRTTGAEITINEFVYNPLSTDDGYEWLELYNAGDEEFPLDGWVLETATSEWAVEFSFESGTDIPAGGFLVVGGLLVAEADILVEGFALGNGTEGDGVRLVDCDNDTRDTVLYGEPMADGLTDEHGNDEVVAGTDETYSLGRYPDGLDNDEIEDWKVYLYPTPGASNPDPSDAYGDGVTPGCGGSRPKTDNPGACSTVVWPGAGALLGALALVRRRR